MEHDDKMENLLKLLYGVNGNVAVMDADNRFVAFSEQVRKMCGFKTIDEMLGKRNHDIKADVALDAAEYELQNQDVLMAQSPRKYFGLNGPYSSGDSFLMIYDKTTMRIQDKNYVFIHGSDLTNEHFTCKWIEILKDDNYYQPKRLKNYLIDNDNFFSLTEREKEVLFYTMRGKTAKECAQQLHISTKTAEFHLMHIKQKFGVYNRSSLIEKALDLGYLYRIPACMVKCGS